MSYFLVNAIGDGGERIVKACVTLLGKACF